MKSSDWAMVVLVVLLVAVAGYFTVPALLGDPVDSPEAVPTAEVINPDVAEPNEVVFNAEAINPAVTLPSDDEQTDSIFRNTDNLTNVPDTSDTTDDSSDSGNSSDSSDNSEAN